MRTKVWEVTDEYGPLAISFNYVITAEMPESHEDSETSSTDTDSKDEL